MQLFKHTIVIARRPEDVFDFFIDLGKGPSWRQYVKSMELVDAGPLGVGSRIRLMIELMGEDTEYQMTVLAFERPTLWRHHTAENNFTGHIEYRFEPEGTGTRVTMVCLVKPTTVLGWLAMPQLWLARGKAYREQLPQLKRAMESA
jgi:hypothetical protein